MRWKESVPNSSVQKREAISVRMRTDLNAMACSVVHENRGGEQNLVLCDHPMLFPTSVWPRLHWSRARTDVPDGKKREEWVLFWTIRVAWAFSMSRALRRRLKSSRTIPPCWRRSCNPMCIPGMPTSISTWPRALNQETDAGVVEEARTRPWAMAKTIGMQAGEAGPQGGLNLTT